jgi:hypothetical protein
VGGEARIVALNGALGYGGDAMSTEAQFEELGTLYRRLAAKHGLDFEEVTTPAKALTDEEIEKIEELTGCKFPPLARAFYKSELARRSPGGVPPFREFYATGEDLLAQCQELREAKDKYDWDHVPLIPVTAEEDFLACTADGDVLRFCGNEGNTDPEDGVENLEQFFAFLISEARNAVESDE